MFKIAKYYLLLNLYQRAKGNIIAIVVSVFAMIFIAYLFGDLIAMAEGSSKYGLVTIKWLILFLLMVVIVFNLRKTVKKLSIPFAKEGKEPTHDVKKERILTKEHLVSRSDLILNKYRNV